MCVHLRCKQTTSVTDRFMYDADVIGRKSLLCITFDRLDWKGDFIASRGIYLNNFGVQIKKDCGLDGDCGLFEAPSFFAIPFFNGNIILQYSYSAWFKRSDQWNGALPTLYSKGACGKAVMEVSKPFIGGMFYSGDGG